MTVFECEHFIIRMFTDEDATDCEAFLSDREVMKFIGDGNFQLEKTTALKMVQWFRQSCNSPMGLGAWAVVSKKTNRVVGNCHLSECLPAKAIEFGLALERSYWGHGYATEICTALLRYGKAHLGLKDVVGTVHTNNLASKRVLKKLGYSFDRFIDHYGICQELYRIDD